MQRETAMSSPWHYRFALMLLQRSGGMLLALAGCLLLAGISYRFLLDARLDAERLTNSHRLDFYTSSLESALAKHEPLPVILGLERTLGEFLGAPQDGRLREAANRYLETVQRQTGIAAAYLINPAGDTLASSNWATPQSFVGQNYAFRPYFSAALNGDTGRFYGVGVTTGEPGYFIAAPLRKAGATIGVVAVKVSLNAIESAMTQSGERLLLADRYGVVFLAARPEWRYRTLAPLAAPVAAELRSTRQYADHSLAPLSPSRVLEILGQAITVRLALPNEGIQEYVAQSRPAGRLGWQLLMLSDMQATRRAAAGEAAAIGFAAAFAAALAVYLRLQRRRRAERLAAEIELEARIAERTSELQLANTTLEQKVGELKQAEDILRETRNDAVQAGKLAVLGQMAAGITHELNQPLAALTTLSDNAVKLLARGESGEVNENLAQISELASRMGRIVGELKSFARKSPAAWQAVSVAAAIEQALFLVESVRHTRRLSIELELPPTDLKVRADPVRLEQVLVNLLRNGLDAMAEGVGDKRLIVSCHSSGKQVVIDISDFGPGIPAEILPHLFEPFYTTKPAGEGLGLGLAISRAIVEGCGGEISAHNTAEGGACFSVRLPAA